MWDAVSIAANGDVFVASWLVTARYDPAGARNVLLYEGTSPLCSAALAPTGSERSSAVCTLILGAGNHVLTATYAGSAVFSESSTSLPLVAMPTPARWRFRSCPSPGLPRSR